MALSIVVVSHQAALEGAERALLDVVDALLERGHRVRVVAASEGPLLDLLAARGVASVVVGSSWWTTAHGATSDPTPTLRSLSRSSERLRRLLVRDPPHVIVTNTSVIPIGAAAAARLGIPHVWFLHEYPDAKEGVRFLLGPDETARRIERSSSQILVNSESVGAAWRRRFARDRNLHVAPNYIRTPRIVVEPPQPNSVDVVIPFHEDPRTVACIASVLRHRSPVMRRLVVRDDASRSPDVVDAVRAACGAGGPDVTYVRGEVRRGFVGTCNDAFEAAERDVVLLNGDTIVTAGWLERMAAVARESGDVATVTALSNNASLVSLPRMHEANDDPDPDESARIVERSASAESVEIPTANGFCMWVARRAVADVGPFDEDAFGLGYGEENDFSMRARARGWRHRAALRAYVYHAGSGSFGDVERERLIRDHMRTLESRYPDYGRLTGAFRADDPLADQRRIVTSVWDRRELFRAFRIAVVGSMVRWKRHHDVLDAAARLRDEGREIALFFAGPELDRVYVEEVRQKAATLGLAERLVTLGPLQDPTGIQRFADVVCVASLAEPFGRGTVEAMACGTPVVGARAGGTADIIEDGVSGLLFEPGEPAALAAALARLADDRSLARSLGEGGRRAVARYLDRRVFAGGVTAAIEAAAIGTAAAADAIGLPQPEGVVARLRRLFGFGTRAGGHRGKEG